MIANDKYPFASTSAEYARRLMLLSGEATVSFRNQLGVQSPRFPSTAIRVGDPGGGELIRR